ncbi:MAG: hypothetical protein LBU84_06370 [Prevotella sp.]|jgi:hypothetical protein|nr:hypothetical protein [Prevotella sp.]
MKTVYNAILGQLNNLIEKKSLRWVDMEKGQLKQTGDKERPPLAYPCALIGIALPRCKDVSDKSQDCTATITVRLVFDPMLSERTSAGAPDDVRNKALDPYDVIADVYKALQGFSTDHFDCLSRTSQGEETHASLFVYKQTYNCQFEDITAEE